MLLMLAFTLQGLKFSFGVMSLERKTLKPIQKKKSVTLQYLFDQILAILKNIRFADMKILPPNTA